MLYVIEQLHNSYIVEWEITTNNYINVTWCLLAKKWFNNTQVIKLNFIITISLKIYINILNKFVKKYIKIKNIKRMIDE